MPDRRNVKIDDVQMRLVTKIGDKVIEEPVDNQELFMATLIIAIRNGKSPANALTFLADLGAVNIDSPEARIGRVNRLGSTDGRFAAYDN